MPKILKAHQFKGQNALSISPTILENFPESIVQGNGHEEIEEEFVEVVDPEAIRAAALTAAAQEIEQTTQTAYEEGFSRGTLDGQEAFNSTIASCAVSLQQAAEALQRSRQHFLDSLTPQIVDLATLIAERVLEREVRTDPDFIVQTVTRAVSKILDREHITLTVHPQDLEALRKHEITLLEEISGLGEITITADESLMPGDCLAESKQVLVDARQEVLLQNVLEQLLD